MNGKRRDEIRLKKGLDGVAVEKLVLELESVRKALDGRPAKKVIVVPDRIVNVVG